MQEFPKARYKDLPPGSFNNEIMLALSSPFWDILTDFEVPKQSAVQHLHRIWGGTARGWDAAGAVQASASHQTDQDSLKFKAKTIQNHCRFGLATKGCLSWLLKDPNSQSSNEGMIPWSSWGPSTFWRKKEGNTFLVEARVGRSYPGTIMEQKKEA